MSNQSQHASTESLIEVVAQYGAEFMDNQVREANVQQPVVQAVER